MIATVPLLAAMGFCGLMAAQNLSLYRAAGRVIELERLADAAAQFAYALPAEWRASRTYAVTGRPEDRASLLKERTVNDRNLGIFRQAIAAVPIDDPVAREDIDFIIHRVEGLGAIRAKADARTIVAADSIGFARQLLNCAYDLVGRVAALTDDPDIKQHAMAYQAMLLVAKGAVGEQATGFQAIRDGSLSVAGVVSFQESSGDYRSFGDQMRNLAPPDLAARWQAYRTTQGLVFDDMRKSVLAIAEGTPPAPDLLQRWNAANLDRLRVIDGLVTDVGVALTSEARARRDDAWTRLLIVSGAAVTILALVILLNVWVLRIVRGLLHRLATAMTALAARHYDAAIPGGERRDEIGEMARAMLECRDGLEAADHMAAAQAQEHRATAGRAVRLAALMQDFDAKAQRTIGMFSQAATQLQSTASALTKTAARTTAQTSSVAATSNLTSANVQTVAVAAEELSASIAEISRQVTQSSKVANLAVADARRTDGVVHALAEGANKIGEIVGLISSIASQTNLLALNATIEAARAGDAGKGFAVVASEVKSLATQTARATDEISIQIKEIQNTTHNAVVAINGIATRIAEVSEIATSIAAAVEEQGAATAEIARNVQQAAAGTQDVTSTIGQVAHAAGETGAMAAEVLQASNALSHQGEMLRTDISQYLDEVRAA